MQLEKIVNRPDVAKVEAALLKGAMDYCEQYNYQMIVVPHMTRATGACENFSTLFATDLFGKTAYLNQTGQLLLEAFLPMFEKTYCFGPSFRKEIKADERHLVEFQLFEIEVANIGLDELKEEISSIFQSMLKYAAEECAGSLAKLGVPDWHIKSLQPPYASVAYRDAVAELGLEFGTDLSSAQEQELIRRNKGRPLFVTHYPQHIKFFNMRFNRQDPSIVNSMDLLLPYSGEAVGAAEREEDCGLLTQRLLGSEMLRLQKKAIALEPGFESLDEKGLEKEALSRFEWYMDIIRQHPIRHAGCGIGMTRVTQALLAETDIRKCTAYPLNRETLF